MEEVTRGHLDAVAMKECGALMQRAFRRRMELDVLMFFMEPPRSEWGPCSMWPRVHTWWVRLLQKIF